MNIFLDKIDAAPIADSNFSFDFNQWIAVLVDTLNEVITDIQNQFNVTYIPSYTSAEIASMATNLKDGVLLYDSDLNVYVGRQGGSLVKFTTTAYP
jgi:hypothetical protein